jgi:hypothetical protein
VNRLLASVGGASVLDFTDRNGHEGVRINISPGTPSGGGGGRGRLRHVLAVQFKGGVDGGLFEVGSASLVSDHPVFIQDIVDAVHSSSRAASCDNAEGGEASRGLPFLVREVRHRIWRASERNEELAQLAKVYAIECSDLAGAFPVVRATIKGSAGGAGGAEGMTVVVAHLSLDYSPDPASPTPGGLLKLHVEPATDTQVRTV